MNELMCVGAFVEAVCLRFCDSVGGWRGHRDSGGCCREWDGWPQGIVTNGEVRVPSVVN
jgi:hypothetical protein